MPNFKKILTFLNSSNDAIDNETLTLFNQKVEVLDETQIIELNTYLDTLYLQESRSLKVLLPQASLQQLIQEISIGQDSTYAVWTLRWLLSLKSQNARLKCFINPKINKLFMLVLETDYAEAKLCYEKFSKHDALQGKGLLLAEGKTIVKAPIINEISSKITNAFALQKDNPLGIVPLCVALFDTPEELAPVVIWMLDNGVSADELIATGLLSVFLLHNINQIDMGYNLVNVFYDLLSQHDSEKTKELLAKTEQTKAYSVCLDGWTFLGQGMLASLAYIQNRSIDGTLHALTENNLTSVSFKWPQLNYQTSKENMAALFEYFGWRFIVTAYYPSPKQHFPDFIRYKSNEVLALLGLLIYEQKYFFTRHLVSSLKEFATLEACKKNLDILHVLSCDEFIQKVTFNLNDIKTLVWLIKEAKTSDKVKLQRLLALFRISSRLNLNPLMLNLIGYSVFQLIIKEDYDNSVYKEHLQPIVTLLYYYSIHANFISKLKNSMTQLTLLNPTVPFSADVYFPIERKWSEGRVAFQRLKKLGFIKNHESYDKYQLNVSILINKFNEQHNLDDLMSFLEVVVPPFDDEARLDEKHRTLIELFCAAVDSRLRDIAFAGLIELQWQGSQHKDKMIAQTIRHNDLVSFEKLLSFDVAHKTKDDWLFDACKILINDMFEIDDNNCVLSINSPEYFNQYFNQYKIIWVKAFCAVLQTKNFDQSFSFSLEIVHFFRMEIETKQEKELIDFVSYLHKQNQTTALSLVGEVIDKDRLQRLFCSCPATLHILVNLRYRPVILTRENILLLSNEIKKEPVIQDRQHYWYSLLVFLATTDDVEWAQRDSFPSLDASLQDCLEGLFPPATPRPHADESCLDLANTSSDLSADVSEQLPLDKETIAHILTTLFKNNRWGALSYLITKIDNQFDWASILHNSMKESSEAYYDPENCSDWMNKLICKKPEVITTLVNSYLGNKSAWPKVLIDKQSMITILVYINSKQDLSLLSSFMNMLGSNTQNKSNFEEAYGELEDTLSDSIKNTKTAQCEATKYRKISVFTGGAFSASFFGRSEPNGTRTEAPPSPERTFTLSIS